MSKVIKNLGPAPSEEECAQIGAEDFSRRNHFEMRLFRDCITNQIGLPPKGIAFSIHYTDNDFGRRGDLVLVSVGNERPTEDEDQKIYEYIENAIEITQWDDISKAEMRTMGYMQSKGVSPS